jgi:ABC transporter substrate binding protein
MFGLPPDQNMRRREFITLVGGAAATWPPTARAQQPRKIPRIGYLMDRSGPTSFDESFEFGLREMGYIVGQNIAKCRRLEPSARGGKSRCGARCHDHAAPRIPEGLEDAMARAAQGGAGAVLIISDSSTISHRAQIGAAALRQRLSTMFANKAYLSGGGLMSYGPDIVDSFRLSTVYVDKILKGAKPADLPVEQPTKFEFAINLKTAKALGIDIPPALLMRVDDVIE